MKLHELIFSNKRTYRISRHILFWLCWIMYMACTQLSGMSQQLMSLFSSDADIIAYQLSRALNRLIPFQVLFCYLTVYFLVPRFLARTKYALFAIYFLVAFAALIIASYYMFQVKGSITFFIFKHPTFTPFISLFYPVYSNINFTGIIPACCLMLAIKYYKDWYKKGRETEALKRENMLAELQLLKAQVHPHFLFNTLNNIYSFTLTESPQAAGLVDKLTGMIDYMSIEGEKSYVPLEKEVQLIKDYIGVEKVRYGDRLELHTDIRGDYRNKKIAPLLMIPFVENCFKHGASIMRGKQWIRLSIRVKDDELEFDLSNSKPAKAEEPGQKKGIGLPNVQKRLQLLYPGRHFLKIEATDDTFIVQLRVSLLYIADQEQSFRILPKHQPA